jgi:hypothetical protein
MSQTQNALSTAGPAAQGLYRELVAALKPLGPFHEEIKKTSIHLSRASAFAGVHPRKEYLIVTIKAEKPIRSPRITRSEQVSKSCWHLNVKLACSSEIDAELLGWLKAAYQLCD